MLFPMPPSITQKQIKRHAICSLTIDVCPLSRRGTDILTVTHPPLPPVTLYQCPKAYQHGVSTGPPDSQRQSEAVDAWEAFSRQLDLYCWLWPECIVAHFVCIVVHKTHKTPSKTNSSEQFPVLLLHRLSLSHLLANPYRKKN